MTATIITTCKKDFFSVYDKLKETGLMHDDIIINKNFKPNGTNYFLITDESFFLISKKEYKFWSRNN